MKPSTSSADALDAGRFRCDACPDLLKIALPQPGTSVRTAQLGTVVQAVRPSPQRRTNSPDTQVPDSRGGRRQRRGCDRTPPVVVRDSPGIAVRHDAQHPADLIVRGDRTTLSSAARWFDRTRRFPTAPCTSTAPTVRSAVQVPSPPDPDMEWPQPSRGMRRLGSTPVLPAIRVFRAIKRVICTALRSVSSPSLDLRTYSLRVRHSVKVPRRSRQTGESSCSFQTGAG